MVRTWVHRGWVGVARRGAAWWAWTSVAVVAAVVLAAPGQARGGPPKADPTPQYAREGSTIPDTPAGAKLRWLIGVLNGDPLGEPADHFTPTFLRDVPASKIRAMLDDVQRADAPPPEEGEGRPPEGVPSPPPEPTEDEASRAVTAGSPGLWEFVQVNPGAAPTGLVAVLVATRSGFEARVELGVDPKTGKIDVLAVSPNGVGGGDSGGEPDPLVGLREMPGRVTAFATLLPPAGAPVEERPRRVLSYQSDLTVSVGDGTLWVVGAATAALASGDAAADEPVTIDAARRSLPPGPTFADPPGSTRTFGELLARASGGDRTACDHLLFRLGRERVEEWMSRSHRQPRLNRPLLSTRELLTLKLAGDENLPKRWNVAAERSRRRMVGPDGAVARAEPDAAAAALWSMPRFVDTIGVFASAEDLCAAVWETGKPGRVAAAVAGPAEVALEGWTRAWRITTREPGVISAVWRLERADGAVFALAIAWNKEHADVEPERFEQEAATIVGSLRAQRAD